MEGVQNGYLLSKMVYKRVGGRAFPSPPLPPSGRETPMRNSAQQLSDDLKLKVLNIFFFFNSLFPLLKTLTLASNSTDRNSAKGAWKVSSHQSFSPWKLCPKLKLFELKLKITDYVYEAVFRLSYPFLKEVCFAYRVWRLRQFVSLF